MMAMVLLDLEYSIISMNNKVVEPVQLDNKSWDSILKVNKLFLKGSIKTKTSIGRKSSRIVPKLFLWLIFVATKNTSKPPSMD